MDYSESRSEVWQRSSSARRIHDEAAERGLREQRRERCCLSLSLSWSTTQVLPYQASRSSTQPSDTLDLYGRKTETENRRNEDALSALRREALHSLPRDLG